MIVFNDIEDNLDDRGVINRKYFDGEMAALERMLINHTDVDNTAVIANVLDDLILHYHDEYRAVKDGKDNANMHLKIMSAYDVALCSIICRVKSYNIQIPDSFIKRCEERNVNSSFTELMRCDTPKLVDERNNEKHEEHKTEEISTLKDYICGDEDNKNSVLNSLHEALANKKGINRSEQLRTHFIPLISEKTFLWKPPYKIFNNEFRGYISRSLYNKLLYEASKPTMTHEKFK
jgi:hypothetical protein